MLEKEKSYIQKFGRSDDHTGLGNFRRHGFIAEITWGIARGVHPIDQEVAALEPDLEDELFQENEQ